MADRVQPRSGFATSLSTRRRAPSPHGRYGSPPWASREPALADEAAFWALFGAGFYLAAVRVFFPNKHVEDDQ